MVRNKWDTTVVDRVIGQSVVAIPQNVPVYLGTRPMLMVGSVEASILASSS